MIYFQFSVVVFLALVGSWAWIPTSHVTAAKPVVNPKKGVAFWDVGSQSEWAGDLAAVGAVWFYNWGPNPQVITGTEAVPMIWCTDVPSTVDGNSGFLLGANEPNLATQCNKSPAEYVSTWHTIEARFSPTFTLVSPATGFGDTNWLVEFRNAFSQTYGTYPNWQYLAVHCYEEFSVDCETQIGTMIDYADSWGADGIWLTEFAIGRQKTGGCFSLTTPTPAPTRTPFANEWRSYLPLVSRDSCVETNVEEMETLLDWLDAEPGVFRYSWFSLRMPYNCAPNCAPTRTGLLWNSSLVDYVTRALTPGGTVYAAH